MPKSEKIKKLLKTLESKKDAVLSLAHEMLRADKGAMFPVDIVALGAAKRFLSTSSAFRLLIEATNLVSSRALLRIHLDTALRFHAIWLVRNPHDFAQEVLAGRQINKMKDRYGNKLTDAFLVSKLKDEYPWVETVYSNLCGYIHLSSQHLFAPIKEFNQDDRSMLFEISEYDTKYPDFSWIEAVECFNEISDIFLTYLNGWIITKENPEMVASLKHTVTAQDS